MMTQNHKLMISLAEKFDESESSSKLENGLPNPRTYIPKAVLASVENGLVSPSMLQGKLDKVDDLNGDFVTIDAVPASPGKPASNAAVEFTLWITYPPDKEKGEEEPSKHVVAFGHSQTWQDALLHAILGFLRECEKGER